MMYRKDRRTHEIRIALTQDQKCCLDIPVTAKTAATPIHPPIYVVFSTTHRTFSTGVSLVCEARPYPLFPGLVDQVESDSTMLHLGYLLSCLARKPFLFSSILLYTGHITYHQFANLVLKAEIDSFSRCFMEHISDLHIALCHHSSLGTKQTTPHSAPFLAPGDTFLKQRERLIPESLDRPDSSSRNDQGNPITSTQSYRVNLSYIDTCRSTRRDRIRFRKFPGISKDVAPLSPHNLCCMNRHSGHDTGIEVDPTPKRQNKSAFLRKPDGLLLERYGYIFLLTPWIPNLSESLFPESCRRRP